jgi:hypothetical protein
MEFYKMKLISLSANWKAKSKNGINNDWKSERKSLLKKLIKTKVKGWFSNIEMKIHVPTIAISNSAGLGWKAKVYDFLLN